MSDQGAPVNVATQADKESALLTDADLRTAQDQSGAEEQHRYLEYAVTPLSHSGHTTTTAPTTSRKSPSPAKLNELERQTLKNSEIKLERTQGNDTDSLPERSNSKERQDNEGKRLSNEKEKSEVVKNNLDKALQLVLRKRESMKKHLEKQVEQRKKLEQKLLDEIKEEERKLKEEEEEFLRKKAERKHNETSRSKPSKDAPRKIVSKRSKHSTRTKDLKENKHKCKFRVRSTFSSGELRAPALIAGLAPVDIYENAAGAIIFLIKRKKPFDSKLSIKAKRKDEEFKGEVTTTIN